MHLSHSVGPGPLATGMAMRLGASPDQQPLRAGLFFVVIEEGLRRRDGAELTALRQLLLGRGLGCIELDCQSAADRQACAQFAAGLAASQQGYLIGVGGEALALQLARAAWTRACPLGLLMRGAERRLAQWHGLPLGLTTAVEAWQRRLATPVAVGLINGEPFFRAALIQPTAPAVWRRPLRGSTAPQLQLRLDPPTQTLATPVLHANPAPAALPGSAAALLARLQASGSNSAMLPFQQAQVRSETPDAPLQLQWDDQAPTQAELALLRLAETPLLLMRGC